MGQGGELSAERKDEDDERFAVVGEWTAGKAEKGRKVRLCSTDSQGRTANHSSNCSPPTGGARREGRERTSRELALGKNAQAK